MGISDKMNQEPSPPNETRHHRLQALRKFLRGAVPFASGVLAALVALLLYNALTPKPHQITQDEVQDTVVQAMASATVPPARASLVYSVIQPSLVLIQSHFEDENGDSDDGLGTGVVINDMGNILTSLHVVENARRIEVTFADGTEASAEVVVAQPENDIAVLQASSLPGLLVPATLGNPNAMNVGDDAYVVGNPFGLYSSMSSGVISGFNRSFRDPENNRRLEGLIQIDTAVNPGNSGGPLLNRNGQVIGIVTALLNPTQQEVFIGIGFAVPIDVAGGAAGAPPY